MKGSFGIWRLVRIAVALSVFVLISAQYFDIYYMLPQAYYNWRPTLTQYVPSLLKMLAAGSLLAGGAFLIFTFLTFVCGRVYCSFICPFGILMDIMRRAAKFPAKNRFLKNTKFGNFCRRRFAVLKFAPAKNILRCVFTLFAALAIVSGFTALLGLIEPYSLYGKIMALTGHLGLSNFANFLSAALSKYEIYSVPPVNGDVSISLAAFVFSLSLTIAIFAAAALRGRLFCNTLCPVGGFLGLLSKFSFFKLRLDKDKCISCKKCERECKAQCIDVKNKSLDYSRCVMCLDCAAVCPKSAIVFASYNASAQKFAPEGIPQGAKGRRDFIKSAPLLASLLCAGAAPQNEKRDIKFPLLPGTTPFHPKNHRPDKCLPLPPGAKSLANYANHCTACQMCVAACPAQMLKPSITEYGLFGFMQPFMDFDTGFCLHECRECSKVCPTGAILPLTDAEKLTEKIGTAVFIEALCVVHTDGTDCSACGEHCPVSAIEMLPYKPEKSLYIPHVHADVCIGCGACENICPVAVNKAIVVQGIVRHTRAKVFEESMRLYVPQKAAPAVEPKALDNPFPF